MPSFKFDDLTIDEVDFTTRINFPMTMALSSLIGMLGRKLFTQTGDQYVVSTTGREICEIITNEDPVETQKLVDALNAAYAEYIKLPAAPEGNVRPIP